MKLTLVWLLLLWTLSVTSAQWDVARGEWIVSYQISDDTGMPVTASTLHLPASTTPAEATAKLQGVLADIKLRAAPVGKGFQVTVP